MTKKVQLHEPGDIITSKKVNGGKAKIEIESYRDVDGDRTYYGKSTDVPGVVKVDHADAKLFEEGSDVEGEEDSTDDQEHGHVQGQGAGGEQDQRTEEEKLAEQEANDKAKAKELNKNHHGNKNKNRV